MLQITRNEAYRAHARRARRQEVGLEEVDAEPVEERAADSIAERLDLRAALAELEPRDRALLEFRYGNDLTQPATAALMGVPEGTVKVRLHRLRSRLRETLEHEWD